MWLLLDKNSICRCMASLPQNLHQDKIDAGMHPVETDIEGGTVGDEFDGEKWILHPENYPQPSEAEVLEALITAKAAEIQRAEAVDALKASGDLPPDYKELTSA